MTMAPIQAVSESTSCTKPRTKPIAMSAEDQPPPVQVRVVGGGVARVLLRHDHVELPGPGLVEGPLRLGLHHLDPHPARTVHECDREMPHPARLGRPGITRA